MNNVAKLQPNLLTLVDYHSPILKKVTEKVKFPLSKEDRQIIQDMKYSIQPEQLRKAKATFDEAAGMAANQWGKDKQIFLFCPTGDVADLEVVINPSYEPIVNVAANSITKDATWEGCFSVPLAIGYIQRYTDIKVTYQDENGKTIVKELLGWTARVWQHENDHLNGFLYDDQRTGKCLEKKQFTSKEGLEEFYRSIKEKRVEKN